jgi:sugar/nucleoside kinase (ribokinase family)
LPTVLVIGDVMTDIIVKPEGPTAVGADTRATIRMLPGGSGANQAAWLAGEGVDVRFVARVGRADHAEQLAVLRAQGVHARLVADDSLPTGKLVTLTSAAERSFFTDRGANESLCRADMPDTLLDGVDLVQVTGYVLFHPGPRAAALELLAEAKRRGIPFTVDPSSWSFLKEVGPEKFLAWIEGARICFPNEIEVAVLSGADDLKEQLAALSRHFPLVVVKHGTEAAYAFERETGRRWSAPVPKVAAIDASGGGDAFFAGFIAAYLDGEDMGTCLHRGVALGARAATTLGGRPTRD